MLYGKKLKNFRLKLITAVAALVCFFIYANVTADSNEHVADVTVLADSALTSKLVSDINNAQKSVYVAMYMFKSYDNITNGAGMIKNALKKAADKGVDVYVAFDSSDDGGFVDKENKKTGAELAKHGVKTIYDSPETRMHSKCAVIDELISYVGSHNYTNSALKHNRELTVRIVSAEISADVIRHIKSIK